MHVLSEEIPSCDHPDALFSGTLSRRDPVFLDSSLVDPHLGRYSYITADPVLTISSKNGRVCLQVHPTCSTPLRRHLETLGTDSRHSTVCDPFALLEKLLQPYHVERLASLPPFQGGIVGYFGYDLGRHLEKLPTLAVDDLHLPDIYAGLYPWVVAFDHLAKRAWIIVNVFDGQLAKAEGLLSELRHFVRADFPDSLENRVTSGGKGVSLVSNFTQNRYLKAIATAKNYIADGDIYQVCLSQRFSTRLIEHPWPIYRRLRKLNPVSYGAYLGFPNTILSASPELFLRNEAGIVETRPIKGTRPRGITPEEDAELVHELRSSEKERAENLMIVDLLRNDLGRVCDIGSVHVPDLFRLESYSTVHHMVSAVKGRLRHGLGSIDLLRASFPGGSVTGCPKIRAMEIIDELEPTRRGIYCGAIGWLGFNGEMDTSIVIRTMVTSGDRIYFQVGGAIVADSDADAEYQETLDKAKSSLLALGLGPNGKYLDDSYRTFAHLRPPRQRQSCDQKERL